MPIATLPTTCPPQGQVSLYFRHENPGGETPVLLLHGLGVSSASWELQIPALVQANYRLLVPDGRGFGQSSYPGGSHSIHDMAGDMAALLEKLAIPGAHVVGISMGGTLALEMALSWPERVKKLVLVNTFASLRPERPSVWLYFISRLILIHTLGLNAQARAVARRLFPRPDQAEMRRMVIEQICQANPRGYRATMRALGFFNVTRRLREISRPTLVITGTQDSTVPPQTQKALAAGIPGARQVFLPAGHAVIAEQPEAFNQVVLEFLAIQEADSF